MAITMKPNSWQPSRASRLVISQERRPRGITRWREDKHEESRRGDRKFDHARACNCRRRGGMMRRNLCTTENATWSRPRRIWRCNEGDHHERATLVTENAMKGSQDMCDESKEAATRMTGLQGPDARQRVAREDPEQSGSQVRVSANGEDGTHLPDSTCLNHHGATSVWKM